MRIRYVGSRDTKRDNIAETGCVWTREQPVHEVSEAAAKLLLRFPNVWVRDEAPEVAEPEVAEPEPPKRRGRAPKADE